MMLPPDRSVPGKVAQAQPAVLTNPSSCLLTVNSIGSHFNSDVLVDVYPAAGVRWTDGIPFYTGFHTVLPPNSPSCETGGSATASGVGSSGVFSARGGFCS